LDCSGKTDKEKLAIIGEKVPFPSFFRHLLTIIFTIEHCQNRNPVSGNNTFDNQKCLRYKLNISYRKFSAQQYSKNESWRGGGKVILSHKSIPSFFLFRLRIKRKEGVK
jgi:apolipoprotein N-acyltransferase